MRDCSELPIEIKESKLNPTRMSILTYLSIVGETKLKDLASELKLSKSVVWKHIKEMKAEGLVSVRYTLGSHPEMVISITKEGLEKLLEYIKLYEKLKECIQGKGDEKNS